MAQALARRPWLRTLGRWVWQLVRGLSAVVGVVAAGIELGRTSLACTLVALWLLGVVVMSLARSAGWRAIGPRWVLAFGLLALAWLGLLLLFGVAGLVWVGTLALTSAPVRRLWSLRHLRPGVSVPAEAPPPEHDPAPAARVPRDDPGVLSVLPSAGEVATLSNDDLCLAWRRSYVQLAQAALASSRARIVACRASILDEIDKRDPEGLGTWLASNPRAAGNPAPYLGSSVEGHDDEELGGDAA